MQDLRFRMPGPFWCGVFCCPKIHWGVWRSQKNPLQKKHVFLGRSQLILRVGKFCKLSVSFFFWGGGRRWDFRQGLFLIVFLITGMSMVLSKWIITSISRL